MLTKISCLIHISKNSTCPKRILIRKEIFSFLNKKVAFSIEVIGLIINQSNAKDLDSMFPTNLTMVITNGYKWKILKVNGFLCFTEWEIRKRKTSTIHTIMIFKIYLQVSSRAQQLSQGEIMFMHQVRV